MKGKRISFARICVKINVDSTLLDTVEVEYANGDSAIINVKYPWKRSRCSKCHVFGHSESLRLATLKPVLLRML